MPDLAFLFSFDRFDFTPASGGVVFGIICACIAASKGRTAVGWFFLGLFFSCFALIVVCCVADMKADDAKAEKRDLDLRHLKEKVRQERIKSRSLSRHLEARVNAHDYALGIDTSKIDAPPVPGSSSNVPAPEPLAWYYDDHGRPAGPVSRSALKELRRAGIVSPTTLVWNEGMTDWRPSRDVGELA